VQAITVYLDLPLLGGLLGWIQDSALLWMVGQITSYKIPLKRCLFGGLAGGVFQFLLLVNQVSAGLAYPFVLSPFLYTVVIPSIMLGIAFYPLNLPKCLKIFIYFYLISFLLAGIQWGIDSLNQRFFKLTISLGWRFLFHLAFLFILGELGWGVVHHKVWEQMCLFRVEVRWNEQKVPFTALLDTGNTLCDPLTKAPVTIVELELFRPYLPPEFLKLAQEISKGEFNDEWGLPEGWDERFRLLPFQSVGSSVGLLAGFRPDELVIWQKDNPVIHRDLIVAFQQCRLSPDGMYQGLISPGLLKHL
jgi:stage II sporulation protein GA (sporulation sigma-E factor processing peptidase)